MADVLAFAEIRIWDHTVGGVAELADGSIVFEYDSAFRRTGLELSPIHLPLSMQGPVRFEELRRMEGFRGLPGLLSDALPDAFGRQVIRAWYTSRGRVDRALSPVQHLLYVGARGIGSLQFRPAEALRQAESEALEISALVADARRIVQGEVGVAVPEIYRIGSSAGGMRPKAVVLYNPNTREVRSAFAPAQPDDIPAILKFDGVGPDVPEGEIGRPAPFNRVEAAYAQMARDAGLNVVDIEMVESAEGHAHLIIPRFDDPLGPGLHQHTFGGVQHVDYNSPGASSYEEYLRTMLRLGMNPADLAEGYRRMLFNVIAVNQDDHVKNLSFHMDREGRWSPTPAYDLTFAQDTGWTAEHQMRVADRRSGITREHLVQVAETFGIRDPHGEIDQMIDVVSGWTQYAGATGVPIDSEKAVGQALEIRRQEIG